MKRFTRHRSYVLVTVALVLFAAGFAMFAGYSSARDAETIFFVNTLGETDIVRQLPLGVNDVIYNPQDQMLYATRPSSAGSNGNSITKIDPISAAPVSSVFLGSEPNKIALSDDGHSMYVVLDGAFGIRRFDTVTQTAGLQFGLGSEAPNLPFTASDIAVVPGNPNRLAVARNRSTVVEPRGGVAIFVPAVILFGELDARLPAVIPGEGAAAGIA